MLLLGIAIVGLLTWTASHHNVRGYSPTTVNKIIAATVFWSTLLAPAVVGLILSLKAIHTSVKPHWPVVELLIVGFLLLVVFGSNVAGKIYGIILPNYKVSEFIPPILVVAAVGTATLSTRLSIRDRKWLLAILSGLAVIGGIIVLLVFNAWAIYLE